MRRIVKLAREAEVADVFKQTTKIFEDLRTVRFLDGSSHL